MGGDHSSFKELNCGIVCRMHLKLSSVSALSRNTYENPILSGSLLIKVFFSLYNISQYNHDYLSKQDSLEDRTQLKGHFLLISFPVKIKIYLSLSIYREQGYIEPEARDLCCNYLKVTILFEVTKYRFSGLSI